MSAKAPSSDDRSLGDKALLVVASASRLLAGEAERTEAERVRKRIVELERALDNLEEAVALADTLSAESGLAVAVASAAGGVAQFVRVATGRPPDRVFNHTRDAIGKATIAINSAIAEGWALWTKTAMASLPRHRLAVLPLGERVYADERERDLDVLARRTSPTAAQVERFGKQHAALAAVLDAVPDPPAKLRYLLEELAKGSLVLSELDDQDITLLRQVGDQIEIRRRRS